MQSSTSSSFIINSVSFTDPRFQRLLGEKQHVGQKRPYQNRIKRFKKKWDNSWVFMAKWWFSLTPVCLSYLCKSKLKIYWLERKIYWLEPIHAMNDCVVKRRMGRVFQVNLPIWMAPKMPLLITSAYHF